MMRASTAVILLILLLGTNHNNSSAPYQNAQSAWMNPFPNCKDITGNELSEAQRIYIIDSVNRFRANYNNASLRHKRTVLSQSSYRKVRYSCTLEAEAKFECNPELSPESFTTANDVYTWRRSKQISTSLSTNDSQNQQITLDVFNQSILIAAKDADTRIMIWSPYVTKIGCFNKICNSYEYIACKTGHRIIALKDIPMETPDKRCKADSDCALPSYTRCDADLGLCDFDPAGRQEVLPSVCFGMLSPIIPLIKENCDNIHDTGSDISQAERKNIVDFVDEMRAKINNNCNLGLGVVKPALNYRKVKYSCDLEKEAMFECSNLSRSSFISDKQTWRAWSNKMDPQTHETIFQRCSPLPYELLIDPYNQTVLKNDEKAVFAKYFMSEEVTKVGCFVKVCGEYEYIACRSNHDSTLPNNAPLYTRGERCNADADCTLQGYHVCDASLGLCDYKSHTARRMEAFSLRCDDLRNIVISRNSEKCYPGGYDTENEISNKEREIIVRTVNHYRQLINNECDLGLGPVKPVSNYRKVKYSCALEENAKFQCPEYVYSKFESDEYTLRSTGKTFTNSHRASFLFRAPSKKDMLIDPNNQTIASTEFSSYIRLMLSPDVTEIGCFVKVCGEYEYFACKTGHVVVAPNDEPLYTPGKRCTVDSDCIIPGYTRCVVDSGLCDIDLEKKIKVSPLACLDLATTGNMPLVNEKCDGVHETGSDISQTEREIVVDTINRYRSMINNKCNLGLGVVKPASNYRKVRYSCALEEKSKFECSSNLTPETFISDKQTWRSSVLTYNPEWRNAIFQRCIPLIQMLSIDCDTQTVKSDDDIATFARLFMSEDVTEVGCFVKLCGENEYIACKTNHDRFLRSYAPLYTPGNRCNIDADCTLDGYSFCDISLGLCDYKSYTVRQTAIRLRCDDVQNILIERRAEKCKPGGYNTGSAISNMERDVIVYTVNHYRTLVNNGCNFGKGPVKPISNYRKVKYSCTLEEDAKFDCSDVKPKFQSNNTVIRLATLAVNGSRIPVFQYWVPYRKDMRIDPNYQTIAATAFNRNFVRLMLSPDVTEIGCFVRVCGEYEYMACKTNDVVVAPKDKPLYTPGSRCTVDSDCNIPGYIRCDADLGLCDFDIDDKPKISPFSCLVSFSQPVPLLKEKCDLFHDTDSNMSQAERNDIVDTVNKYRSLINNNCNLGLGVVKPASNYRKVKYSCRLEKEVDFYQCKLQPEMLWRKVYSRTYDQIWYTGLYWYDITRFPIFGTMAPYVNMLDIYPENQTVKKVYDDNTKFMKLFMSEGVTEVGCTKKYCGYYEIIACKSNYNRILPNDLPLYTPGPRCNADEDCTLPGYPVCDVSMGLCDYKSHTARQMEALLARCDDVHAVKIYREYYPEKCNPGGYDTGSKISNIQREIIVHTVNHYRQLINNECDLGKGPVKPISNYRKVKYSCELEMDAASEFSCGPIDAFKSGRYTLRYIRNGIPSRIDSFILGAPLKQDMLIDPGNQTSDANDEIKSYLRFMLSPDVTEVGCFIKDCGSHEYMACKTGHAILVPTGKPLYTPGSRCIADEDCTLPGYGICDVFSGLCEADPKYKPIASIKKYDPSKCEDVQNVTFDGLTDKCSSHYDTGSEMSTKERETIVHVVNQFRQLINDECDLGKGNVKPASNYRKVKYNCGFEEDAKLGGYLLDPNLGCSKVNLTNFKSDDYTWRYVKKLKDNTSRNLFGGAIPRNQDLLIGPFSQTSDASQAIRDFIRLILHPDATAIGCYRKVCNGYEYYACKSGYQIVTSKGVLLYHAGKRCEVDADCTKIGYRICDVYSGLCEAGFPTEIH